MDSLGYERLILHFFYFYLLVRKRAAVKRILQNTETKKENSEIRKLKYLQVKITQRHFDVSFKVPFLLLLQLPLKEKKKFLLFYFDRLPHVKLPAAAGPH